MDMLFIGVIAVLLILGFAGSLFGRVRAVEREFENLRRDCSRDRDLIHRALESALRSRAAAETPAAASASRRAARTESATAVWSAIRALSQPWDAAVPPPRNRSRPRSSAQIAMRVERLPTSNPTP